MTARTITAAALSALALAAAGCGADSDKGATPAGPPKPTGDAYGNIVVLRHPDPSGDVSAKAIATACPLRGKELADVAINNDKNGDLSRVVVTCRPRAAR